MLVLVLAVLVGCGGTPAPEGKDTQVKGATGKGGGGRTTGSVKSEPLNLAKLKLDVWKADPDLLKELDDNPVAVDQYKFRLPRGWQPRQDNAETLRFQMQTYLLPYGAILVYWGKQPDGGYGPNQTSPKKAIQT